MRTALALLATLAVTPGKPQTLPQTVSIDCPEFIETTQALKTQVEGWTHDSRRPRHALSDVEFFEGLPSQLFGIHGERVGTVKKPLIRWELTGGKPIWVSCSYVDTSIFMTRQLPPGLTRCELAHEPGSSYVIRSVVCW